MITIQYGLHFPSGKNRAPSDAQDAKGRGANVECLGCGERLQHVNRKPTAYYRHDAESSADAETCAETALHVMAKDIAANLRGVVKLPSWIAAGCIEFYAASGATEVDASGGSRKPIADAALWNERGQAVAVEVKVTHGKDGADTQAYRAARVPVVEIAAPDFVDDAARTPTEASVRDAILRAGWLVQPFETLDHRPLQSPLDKAWRRRIKERKTTDRRRKTIDKAVALLNPSPVAGRHSYRIRTPRAIDVDRSGYAVKWGFRSLLMEIGADLMAAGFEQHGDKPYLFKWRLPVRGRRIVVYADLGGMGGLPAYQYPHLSIYAFGISCAYCSQYYDHCKGDLATANPYSDEGEDECNGLTPYLETRVRKRLAAYRFGERLEKWRKSREGNSRYAEMR